MKRPARMTCTSRRQPLLGRRSIGSHEPTRLTRTDAVTFCRRFTLRCGAASRVTVLGVHSAPGFTGWHTIPPRRTSFGNAATAQNLVSLEEIEVEPYKNEGEVAAAQHKALERLLGLIQRLKPLDRQIVVSYLEGMDAASIGDITGISPGNVATKIHRIKSILVRRFHEGGRHDQ